MRIYHGSRDKVDTPIYGLGKKYNDYGLGFYCTKNEELAKEWACTDIQDGYANVYDLDTKNLNVLYLNSKEYTILHWLTILLENRTFRLTNPIAKEAKMYLIKNFHIDTSTYDIIIGYRADDSYFSFAEDFLNNGISIQTLSKAMYLGNLGEQVVLVSEKAFTNITYIESIPASRSIYYAKRMKRDIHARKSYVNEKTNYNKNDLYMIDIMREEVKEDDARLR